MPVRTSTPVNERLQIGRVAVDSGQLMITDPCYLDRWVNNDFSEDAVARGERTYDYAGACATTLSVTRAGELGSADAVVSSTGYGDGLYPVYATYDAHGRVVKLEVVFDWEVDEDEDENEEDGE